LTIGPLRIVLGFVGGAVLLVLGARTLWTAFRVRAGGEVEAEVASPRKAFATALAGTASNPLTIASWAAVFAAASAGGAASSPIALVAGVGLGSLAWMTGLATGIAAARRAIGTRAIALADAIAGLGLIGFGAVLTLRAGS
jgi:putative LysE/RhtB family amino acid efflux pump